MRGKGGKVSLRDVQIADRHRDPRTTMRHDRARKNLNRHPNYILAAYMASGTQPAARGSADDSASWLKYVGAMATYWTLGCDADDPQRLAAFWAFALGYVKESGFDEPDNASVVDPNGRGPAIGFLKVPEGKAAKNRMHIDVRVAGPGPWDMDERARLIRQKVPELVAAGATVVREEWYDDALGHVVMQDPEGNEFCVA